MSEPIAFQRYFLDTSALLFRFLAGATGRSWMQSLCDPDSRNLIAIAEISEAELAATLNQLVRGGVLRKRRCERASELFWSQVDAGEYQIISVTSPVVRHGANLCGIHALKGYDSVQLACALAIRNDMRQADATLVAIGQQPLGDPIFLTEDNKLGDAARAEGFIVDSPLNHP